MLKQQKGMTLTILVLSIVAVLALAAIAIAMVLDELSYDPEPVQIYTEQQVENNDKAVVIDNGTTDVTEVTENAE